MSHNKLSPRQKMISMMYLVLTAMLAMNVSKEILNAFITVNEGIQNSNTLVKYKNDVFYNEFLDNTKFGNNNILIKNLILETQNVTLKSIAYIDILKSELLTESGVVSNTKNKVLFANIDDLETGTRLLTESINGIKPKGELLRLELSQIKEKYLQIIENGNLTEKNTKQFIDFRKIFDKRLPLQSPEKNTTSLEGENISWVNKNFFNVPVVATDVILSKIQNDIYSSEFEVLNFLQSQLDSDLPKFDKLNAAIISPKSYLSAGNTFEANIFISASSSSQNYQVYIGKLDKNLFNKDKNGGLLKTHSSNDKMFFTNEYTEVPIENGKAKFSKVASGIGVKYYEGIIKVKIPTGGFDFYPFEFDYEVAPKSSFSISPSAMNVLYIGLENPLSITVSGSKDSDVSTIISKGEVYKKGSSWYAKVSQQGKVFIDVFGVVDDVKKKIGTQEFRVKRIPDPISTLDGVEYSNSKISKSRLKQHKYIFPKLKDFIYDVQYKIVSYDFALKSSNNERYTVLNNGTGKLSPKVKSFIKNVKSGDVVFFTNIKAIGPDGKRRKINSIFLTVK